MSLWFYCDQLCNVSFMDHPLGRLSVPELTADFTISDNFSKRSTSFF